MHDVVANVLEGVAVKAGIFSTLFPFIVGVVHVPFLQANRDEKGKKPAGDHGQEFPENPVAQKRSPSPIESYPLAVNYHVLGSPALNGAVKPRRGEAASNDG